MFSTCFAFIFCSGNGADSKIHISVHMSKSAVCPYIYLEPEFETLPNLYFTRQVSLKHFLDHHRLVKKKL